MTACTAYPAQDEGIYGVGADGEDDHAEVADSCVEGHCADDETDDGDGF